MLNIKQLLLRIFWIIELALFMGIYLLGPYGIQAHKSEFKKINSLSKEIDKLSNDVYSLEIDISDFKSENFYKEKIAREELQMAYPGETVYYINNIKG